MNFYRDIHGSQTMYPNDFSDPLKFHLAPPSGQKCKSVHVGELKESFMSQFARGGSTTQTVLLKRTALLITS